MIKPMESVVGGTAEPRRSAHRQTIVVWALWVGSVVFVVAGLITARAGGPDDPVPATVIGVAVLSFATVGAILVSRLPANVIGWLLALGGFCLAVGNGAGGLADYGLTVHPGSIPGAIWFAWLTEWIWAPALGAVVGLALVYPSGRLLTARWRPVAAAAVLIIALTAFGSATGPWPAGIFPVANPLLIAAGAPGSMPDMVGVVAGPSALLVALLAVASLVLRYRRAAGIERAQLKWFAFVTAISVPAFLVTAVLYGNNGVAPIVSNVAGLVAFGGFAFLPVAIGIAVLRYRLYEIDRLISRTISWAAMTVLIAGLFVGFILALQAILAPLTGSSTIAVAGSILIVATLFARSGGGSRASSTGASTGAAMTPSGRSPPLPGGCATRSTSSSSGPRSSQRSAPPSSRARSRSGCASRTGPRRPWDPALSRPVAAATALYSPSFGLTRGDHQATEELDESLEDVAIDMPVIPDGILRIRKVPSSLASG